MRFENLQDDSPIALGLHGIERRRRLSVKSTPERGSARTRGSLHRASRSA